MKSIFIRSFIGAWPFFLLSIFPMISCTSAENPKQIQITLETQNLKDIDQLPVSDKTTQRMYLVRHGESTANVYFEREGKKVRYVSGQSTDIPLTELGKEQVEELAKKLVERFPLQARIVIVNSSALRTRQTAKIIFEELSKSIPDVILAEEVYDGINERSLGKWEGELRDEKYVEAESHWRSLSAAEKFIFPEVESAETHVEVAKRAYSALADIHDRYPDSTVIVVSSFNAINDVAIQVNNLQNSLSEIAGSSLPKMDLANGDLVLFAIPKDRGFGAGRMLSHIKNN